MEEWQKEISDGRRFQFGKNWTSFVNNSSVDELLSGSLLENLDIDKLVGDSILDIGCGSGIFSGIFFKKGRNVTSLDFDPKCVQVTKKLKKKLISTSAKNSWIIKRKSILDPSIEKLGQFDIVFSWGVLHHTGNMKLAINNSCALVRKSGHLVISIYNDQGWKSSSWLRIKQIYNANFLSRYAVILCFFPTFFLPILLTRILKRKNLRNPRGMHIWFDFLDWLGGLPFEVSSPSDIILDVEKNGFKCISFNSVGKKMGCNEFVFKKN